MFRRFTRSIAAIASVATIGLFAIPEVAHAASIDVTVSGADGGIARAMVAVLNSDGDAIDSVIADSTGKVTIDDTNAASLVIAAPGFQTKVVTPVAAGNVALTASTKSKLSYSNAYGGQVRTIAADADSGVFYATTDAQPSVWRTTDYAGSWAPVPTSADDAEASNTSAGAMTQNQSAGEIFTSAAKGEVGVQVGNELFYSRNYGNTWSKIQSYSNVTGTSKKHFWLHGGSSGQSSAIFVATSEKLFAAVVPDSKDDTATPTFGDVTTSINVTANVYAPGDRVGFAVGANGDMFMIASGAAGTKVSQITIGSAAANISGALTAAQPTHTMPARASGGGQAFESSWIHLSTLGTNTPQAFASLAETATAANFAVGAVVSGAWSVSTSFEGTSSSDSFASWDVTGLKQDRGAGQQSNNCGWNGNTGLVGSIAPIAPAGALAGLTVAGSIGSCMFTYNASGAAVTIGAGGASRVFATTKVQLLAVGGANNNTGFVWDAGFNFSTDATTGNMVTISGDGKYGLRKSAKIDSSKGYRPQFGDANPNVSQLLASTATAGKDPASGGIAVVGMSAPNVTDVVYDPNSTDGSRLVLSMTDTGGGRTLISTDGGTSFSTLGASGSRSLDWWNGADGKQHIAATFTLGSDYMQIKSFKTATGEGALEMGDELAATAAVRDAKDPAARKSFAFGSAVTPAAGGQLRDATFIPSGGTTLNTAIEGIVGKDMVLVAVNKCSDNVGPTGCTGSAASVGLLNLSVNASTGAVTTSSIKFFGSDVDSNGVTSAPNNGTYSAGVSAIQYCPVGSAPKVADTAFVSVGGKGLYKISAVTTSPKHEATGTTTGTYTEMKIDCDTGLIGIAGSTGLFMSIDGGAKFFELKTGAAQQNQPNPPQGGQGGGTTAIAVQADATTGEVTVAVASGNGDVKSIETSFTDLGLKGSDVAAGIATSPTTAVTPKTEQINEVNSSSTGKNTGAVPDLELPPAAGDKVTTSAVRVSTVRVSAASGVKLAVGTAGGAFKATVKNGSITAPAVNQPAANQPTNQPAAGTPAAGTPAAAAPKTVTITVKKIITVSSALKTLGISVVAKSKIVPTSTTKTICAVMPGVKVKGLKAGLCKLTVKITPPATKKVPKPKTTTKRITITIK